MAKMMLKPDVVFDGPEFSAMTRFLDALHDRKDLGLDEKALEAAQDARHAFEMNAPIAEESVKALVQAVDAYKKAVEDRKFGNGAPVKGEEPDHCSLIRPLVGRGKMMLFVCDACRMGSISTIKSIYIEAGCARCAWASNWSHSL